MMLMKHEFALKREPNGCERGGIPKRDLSKIMRSVGEVATTSRIRGLATGINLTRTYDAMVWAGSREQSLGRGARETRASTSKKKKVGHGGTRGRADRVHEKKSNGDFTIWTITRGLDGRARAMSLQHDVQRLTDISSASRAI